MTTNTRDPALASLVDALCKPFEPSEVKWKAQSVKGNRALAVAFVDARLIQDRLDEVVGVENWQDVYEFLPDGSVVCRLRLKLGGKWITKTDVGSPSEQPDAGDRVKAAVSDALKRAAVKFGVSRYLYRLPAQWCDYDPVKKNFARLPQLPNWAMPKATNRPPAEQKIEQPAKIPEPPTIREQLGGVMKSVGWSWPAAMKWLASAYPQDAKLYHAKTKFDAVDSRRIDHLIRHLNTLSVQKGN